MKRAIGLSLITILLLASSMANATTILQPVNVWTDGQSYSAPIGNVINQSGLSASYTSGVDDFNTFVSGTTADYSAGVSNTLGDTSAQLDNYYFDLGSAYAIEALAVWNQAGTASLNTFDIFAATDSTFNSTSYLGSFAIANGPFTAPGNIYNFASTLAQYFMIDVTSNYGFSSATRINEVAFGINDSAAASAVPEPSTMLLLGSGLFGVIALRKKLMKN